MTERKVDSPEVAHPVDNDSRSVSTTFAHLSDLHTDRSPERSVALERTVATLVELSETLDFVLVTGDITQNGLTEEYLEVRRAFGAFTKPIHFCPGNHDAREPFAEILLGEKSSAQPLHRQWQYPLLRVLTMDSMIPGLDSGTLDEVAEEWVNQALSETVPGIPIVMAFHHTPLDWHPPYLESLDRAGMKVLRRILRRHDLIAAVLGGHFHNSISSMIEGVPVVAAPSVAPRIAPPWERANGVKLEPDTQSGMAVHSIDGNGSVTSYFRRIT